MMTSELVYVANNLIVTNKKQDRQTEGGWRGWWVYKETEKMVMMKGASEMGNREAST